MATTNDHLVTIVTGDQGPTSHDDSILDLSQRSTCAVIIDDWTTEHSSVPVDSIAEDEWKLRTMVNEPVQEYSMSDNVDTHRSTIDAYRTSRKKPTRSMSPSVVHELQPCLHPCPCASSTFLWSKYLAVIGERAVSEEFFDHYLASIESSLEIDMQLEYCYDVQNDFFWLTQIQLIAHSLILLHYVGLPEDDTSHDFWAYFYGQRCHPIGWCKEHRKALVPPSIVITQQENGEAVPTYLFDQTIGLTPAEQLHVGMLLELQDLHRPWTLWFVRIVSSHGGRLHLRYVTSVTDDLSSKDIHLFYLDYRLHPIGWISSIYSYDTPTDLPLLDEKQAIITRCLSQSKKQFLPPNVFKEQEEISKHRFTEGMKLEVFESITQQIYVGRIGQIHNEFYFDVHIDHDTSQVSFVAHSTHPHLLPPHWAAEHRLALMKGQGVRHSDDYWSHYTEKHGITDLASERCFNLITLNAAGSHRAEPEMKMELICLIDGEDRVFSVTLIHVADHLMWLRVDNPSCSVDEHHFYHVLPINSLDVFPVGWARHHGFELILPMEYPVEVKTHQINRYELFSSVTRYPRIPRIYLSDVYLLTLYVNIRCFSGPHFCSSRLARMPSKFGPGPYRLVLLDMFHHLLSASSTTAHRAFRRLDQQSPRMTTEYVKSAKKTTKLIRPISIPTEARLVAHYLRHVCTQLEVCANLISLSEHLDQMCPDRCHRLNQTFTFASHSKHKRTGVAQLRAAQNRQRKPKSLLGHLKDTPTPVEEAPGSDRQTRGFRLHIEPRTHTVTRTHRKQKILQDTPTIDSKRGGKKKRPLSPDLTGTSNPPPVDTRNPLTWNVSDVCWYLNESGCSFALKTIQEQEIDGAALLLLDDLNTVQDLLEFKLGPAVKFFHVVEQLRRQVIDTIHSNRTSC